METKSTLGLLAILLKAPEGQLRLLVRLTQVARHEEQVPLEITELMALFRFNTMDDLHGLTLPLNDKREHSLADLILNLTVRRIEWIANVRDAEWDADRWRTTAIHLFTEAFTLGIDGVACFAIVAASMHLQAFERPAQLPSLLWGACQNVLRMDRAMAEAEALHQKDIVTQPEE